MQSWEKDIQVCVYTHDQEEENTSNDLKVVTVPHIIPGVHRSTVRMQK